MSSMKASPGQVPGEGALRRRAEAVLACTPQDTAANELRAAGTPELIHELQVHELELTMQNEELRRSHLALIVARDAYRALYDGAPVGYLTLDKRGFVHDANVTAAGLLGIDRARLQETPLSALMTSADADTLHLHLVEVFESQVRCTRELDVQRPDGTPISLRLDSIAAADGASPSRCRTTLTDVSETRHMQAELRALNHQLEQRVDERTEQLRVANKRLFEQLRERERTEQQLLHARKLALAELLEQPLVGHA